MTENIEDIEMIQLPHSSQNQNLTPRICIHHGISNSVETGNAVHRFENAGFLLTPPTARKGRKMINKIINYLVYTQRSHEF